MNPNVVNNIHSGTTKPSVCAIVLNWNAYNDTRECIESLNKIEYDNFKIVIIDNASIDGSGEKLSRAYPDISFLKLNYNGGYAAGNNEGILWGLQKDFEYFLVLNNDTIVESDFLLPLIETLEADPSYGIVTGKVLYYNQHKHIYSAGGYFSKLFCTGVNGKFKAADELSPQEEMTQDISFVPGCMMLVQRKVFEHFGLLDEKYFLYFEDLEFSRRVSSKYKLGYIPSSRIYHKSGGGTRWSNYTPTYLYYHSRNRFWVFRDAPILYRAYVFLYSFLNAFAKTVIIIYLQYKETKIFPWKQIKAIWKGIIDGIIK
jgi:hypothetical protein